MLTGATRLEPCVLVQNPVIWEFNPDWESKVGNFTQNPIIWELKVGEHVDTDLCHVGI